jgi:hypothetical protein
VKAGRIRFHIEITLGLLNYLKALGCLGGASASNDVAAYVEDFDGSYSAELVAVRSEFDLSCDPIRTGGSAVRVKAEEDEGRGKASMSGVLPCSMARTTHE